MQYKKIIFTLLFAIVIFSLLNYQQVNSTPINKSDIPKFVILEDNMYIILNETNFAIVLENIKLNFTATTSDVTLKILAEKINQIGVFEGKSELEYNLLNHEDHWELKIILNETARLGEIKNFTIIYVTDSYCEKTEEKFVIFDFPYISNALTEVLKIKIRLPKFGSIVDEKFAIFPKPNKNWTDGTYFFFEWQYYSIDVGVSFIIHMKYFIEEERTTIHPTPTSNEYNYFINFIIGIPIGLTTSFTIYFITEKLKKRKRKREKEGIISLGVFLNENEKKVLHSVIKHKGKCWQSEIVMDTNLSKAAVSLALVSLEKKGLIMRERMGRENLVRTTEKLEKIKELLGN